MEKTPSAAPSDSRIGAWLVVASAVAWSSGGSFGRLIGDDLEAWTIVFWRSLWAAAFLLGFMLLRDGPRATLALFPAMGWPGLAVALLFGSSSTAFVLALQYTTVANILLIQAGAPLIAALMAWVVLGERVSGPTAVAIAAVLLGIGVMVSDSLSGATSWLGNALALWLALGFSAVTVVVRRFARVRMVPAVCAGTVFAAALAGACAGSLRTTPGEMLALAGFGSLNLGLGLALFVTGARLVPAAVSALLGVLETMLGPLWVWLFFDETPAARTLAGGGIVLAALVGHIAWQLRANRRG